MNRKAGIGLLIAGLVAGLVLGSFGIATALSSSGSASSTVGALGVPRGGFGHGRGGGMGGGADSAATVSKLTGLTESDVRTKRAAGESYEAIAKAKGVSANAVIDRALADATTLMDAEVKVGRMTSAQETQALADLKTRLQSELTSTTAMSADGVGRGMHGGGGLASAVASLTAMSVDDVMTQRATGKSFAQIAQAKGVSADQIVAKALETATTELKTRLESDVNTTSTVGPAGLGDGFGGHGGHGGPGAPGGF